MSGLEDRYSRIRYPAVAHPSTHPAHVGAVAKLYGMSPPTPQTASILELGSAAGTNLNWIARTLPDAQCLGTDIIPETIADARAAAAKQGLGNVSFIAADLLNHDFGNRKFDYIIAHGLFSWVDEPVQQRALEVCRDNLAENGVALISYNAMPGCSTRDALRKLFLLEVGDSADNDETLQLGRIDRVLSFFEAVRPTVKAMPHGDIFDLSVQVMRKKNKGVLLHDEAGVVYEPYYLLQFFQWATETGLNYIADANLMADWMDGFPLELREAIHNFRLPRMKALQYADYVFNTSFRSSLLCHPAAAEQLKPLPDPDALRQLWIVSGKPNKLRNSDDEDIAAFVRILKADSFTSCSVEEVVQRLFHETGRTLTAEAFRNIARYVLQSASRNELRLSLGPPPKLPRADEVG